MRVVNQTRKNPDVLDWNSAVARNISAYFPWKMFTSKEASTKVLPSISDIIGAPQSYLGKHNLSLHSVVESIGNTYIDLTMVLLARVHLMMRTEGRWHCTDDSGRFEYHTGVNGPNGSRCEDDGDEGSLHDATSSDGKGHLGGDERWAHCVRCRSENQRYMALAIAA